MLDFMSKMSYLFFLPFSFSLKYLQLRSRYIIALIFERSRSRERKRRLMDLAHNGDSAPRKEFKKGPHYEDKVNFLNKLQGIF